MNFLRIIFILILINNFLFSQEINLTLEEKDFLKKNSPIRLHNELNWPPYNFNENGQPKGFSIDYMNLLAKKLNIDIVYITGPSWDEFMNMLQEDKLDAIINISKNEQRAKTIAFTSIFHTAANAIYVKRGNEYLDSLEKLEGKTLVMPKGFFAQKAIAKYYPKIKQILVKDTLECLKVLSLGNADATIGKKNVIDYVITLNNISGVVPTNYVDDNRMVSLIRIGTSKDKTILRDIFEKAQKNVTDEEILALKRKWFGVKDILNSKPSNFLNINEIKYINSKKIFRMCNIPDLKPIEFFENSKFQGITIDILKSITDKTNMRFLPVKTNSWEEAKSFLKEGKCDFIPTVTKSEDLIDFSTVTKPFLSYKLAIITQKNKPVATSLEDILDKSIAKRKDSKIIQVLRSSYPDLKVIETNTNRESLEAVSKGNAYFALEPLPIASYYISNYALKNLYISRYTNMPFTVHMAVAKDNKLLLSILNKSINNISQTERREIFSKWTASSLNYKAITDYEYFWEIVSTLLFLILIFSYRHYVLDKLNKNLTSANEEIEKKTKELEKQKLLFETLYTKSADGVILIRDGIISSCNEATLKILKFDESEIINNTLENLAPAIQPDSQSSKTIIKKYMDEALNDGVVSFELVLTDASQSDIWAEIVFTSIEIESKLFLHTVIRDITSRKNLEQKLEDLNSNLEKRVIEEIKKNEINTQRLVQQSRLAQMGEMISMIAHQWRQPLSAISATTNNLILKMMISDEVDKKYFDNELKLITEYSQHLSSTIDDFRNFFKTDKEKVCFKLNQVINKSLYLINTALDSNGIKLEKHLDETIEIYSYPSELQQVILNILKNAEDALNENTNIKDKQITVITYKKDNSKAIIEIIDNAGGISNEVKEKIFDPYFSTKTKKDGTGLGLYMSKIIINEHCNGRLFVSNANDGANFQIELPLYKKV
ncbi:transporter substrate-binding domain-containing protein [Arcobacter arenosus]|uniref:transporter substrate-binding domain-containing protein n=1 Tax=Arcobacter arenosus TaxID=2576037 RepID=UPI003BAA276E